MKSLFFFLTLWTFLPLFAGYAPDNVQTALTKMYPSAKGIAWSAGRGVLRCGFYDERI